MARKVADRRVIGLVRRMLQAKVVMPDGTRIKPLEGTPQGGPLSPFLSCIVLDELDQELARRGHRFVRYADDCYVFVRSARAGDRVMASITRFLEGRMRLPVNRKKSAVRHPGEVHFLGVPLSASRRWGDRCPSLPRNGAATGGYHPRDDAHQLGALALIVYGGSQPLLQRVDGALPALHGRGCRAIACIRRPYPPSVESDHRASEEATPLPSPASFGNGGEPQGCRQRRVLRPGCLAPVQPSGHDAGLSGFLVHRTTGIAEDPMGGT